MASRALWSANVNPAASWKSTFLDDDMHLRTLTSVALKDLIRKARVTPGSVLQVGVLGALYFGLSRSAFSAIAGKHSLDRAR